MKNVLHCIIWKLLLALTILLPTSGQAQIITTFAGTGTAGFSGDGGQATAARIRITGQSAIYADSKGNVYFTDDNRRVRKVDALGYISTFAGTGIPGYSGDGGPATAAQFMEIRGLVGDAIGNLYIGDFVNHRIRMVDTNGIISTIAGTGVSGYSADGGYATAAMVSGPQNMAADRFGSIYFSDWNNARVRKINSSGNISTVAGNGIYGYSGDGGFATAARIQQPYGIAFDAIGNLYIADLFNHVIRKVDTAGIISTFAGTGITGYSGDSGQATMAMLNSPYGLAVDAAGNVFVSDLGCHCIRMINNSGIISTLAGNGFSGFGGDGGPATAAQLYNPSSLFANCSGDLFCADNGNHRIRKITFTNTPPYFAAGSDPVSIAACAGLPLVLDSFLTVTDTNIGQQLTWSLLLPPAHGVAIVNYGTAATGGAITPVGLYYTPTAGYSGTDTFRVMVADCGGLSSIRTFYATITPLPDAGTISGTDTLCLGDTVALAATISGGNWGSSNTSVATISATGQAVGLAVGPATIRYLVTNSCGTDTATHSLLVLPAGLCHTGIGTIAAAGLHTLYPNPASGVCNLYLPGAGVATITLTDITGRVVQVVETYTANTTIPLTEVPAGTYLIVARWAGGVWNGRLVAE